jgi:hypothetical protein
MCTMSVGTRIAGKDVAHVDVGRHSHDRLGCARARPETVAPPDEADQLLVVVLRGSHLSNLRCRGVGGAPVRDDLLDLGGCPAVERIAGNRTAFRNRVVQDQPERPLGIRRGEQQAHRRCLECSEQECRLRPDRLEHRAKVVHSRLERRRLAHPVGKAGAAPVEEHDARERREAIVEAPVVVGLELDLEIAREAMEEHEVRPGPVQGRVGDRDVAALRIADEGLSGHHG